MTNGPLRTLEQILCPTGSGLRLAVSSRRDDRTIARWLAFPSPERPRLLTPAAGAPAMAAFAQFNDAMSTSARLRKVGYGAALRLGAGSLLGRHGVALEGRPAEERADLIGSVLPSIVGERTEVAVMLGAGFRPNAKPVLQLTRRDGRVLAYAKIGWNELTKALLANEHIALASWVERPPVTFMTPRPLAFTSWEDLSILLISPVPHAVLRHGPRGAVPSIEVLREVAEHGPSGEGELRAAPSVARLLHDLRSVADVRVHDAVETALGRVLDRDGASFVRWGTRHGDWGPWNMSRTRGGLYVWDWERSEAGVPVGFDLLHFHFQRSVHGARAPARVVAIEAVGRASEQLKQLGVRPAVFGALMTLYIADVLLRLEAGLRSGVAVRSSLLLGLVDALDRGLA